MTAHRQARTETAQDMFDGLAAAHLHRSGVTLERVFHNKGLKVNAKLYAFVSKDRLVLKLPDRAAAALVSAGQATPFEPRPGRQMRQWVALEHPRTTADERRWQRLMDDACAYVGTDPPTTPPRRTSN